MNKVKKKAIRINDRFRTQAIHWVAAKHQVSPQYIYGLLNGNNAAYGRADELLKDYHQKYAELKQVLS